MFSKTDRGIACQAFTEQLFDPLDGLPIVYILTCIQHAIREYETGSHRKIKIDGAAVYRKSANIVNLSYCWVELMQYGAKLLGHGSIKPGSSKMRTV